VADHDVSGFKWRGLKGHLLPTTTTNNMASGVDPVATLRQALTLPTDSPEQANVLATLRENLENVSSNVPVLLLRKLVPGVQGQPDSLFKQWVFDLVWYCICRAPMSIQERTRRE
jgi:symplekin